MFNFFLKHKDLDKKFDFQELKISVAVKDVDYIYFISKVSNGGFFLAESLVIYPHTSLLKYPDIEEVNRLLNEEFGVYFSGLISFGQDIFGNQFCFERNSSNILQFNIEDASRSEMGNNFRSWMEIFVNDYDYYSGYSYSKAWRTHHFLNSDQRLCPKKPFTIGGDFTVENFYPLEYPEYLKVNADIAKQIHDLPDGSKVYLTNIPRHNIE